MGGALARTRRADAKIAPLGKIGGSARDVGAALEFARAAFVAAFVKVRDFGLGPGLEFGRLKAFPAALAAPDFRFDLRNDKEDIRRNRASCARRRVSTAAAGGDEGGGDRVSRAKRIACPRCAASRRRASPIDGETWQGRSLAWALGD
jgi:hypothetical protein